MICSLVGYTGFVGSNLAKNKEFNRFYNSQNIKEAFYTNPDLLVYAGLRSRKFWANTFPEKDFETIKEAQEIIKKINPSRIVFISTVDVYEKPFNVTENSVINIEKVQPYGKNRLFLEEWIKNNFSDSLIIRLPGLYGENIQKNFIYDMIHCIPSQLKKEKYLELVHQDKYIEKYYIDLGNGFFQCKKLSKAERSNLKKYFEKIGFTALNFTDSRGVFQYYNLKFLWHHIQIALKNNISILNIATEPVSVQEIYKKIFGTEFKNYISDSIPYYNFKTEHDELFQGKNGYIFDKAFILEDINQFVKIKRRTV